ncbi:MAG: class I SAM-dependent methyltransferase [Desulfobacterales bacterium]
MPAPEKGMISCHSKPDSGVAFEMPAGPIPRCPACLSLLHRMPENSKPQGSRCKSCGLIVQPHCEGPADLENMVRHYRAVDPHEKVAISKTGFFQNALDYLDSKVTRIPRHLLDVGCGFGYFLEKAMDYGWEPIGVDVVPEAVFSAQRRVPTAGVFLGDLRKANLPTGSIDAVTMWDVLCHVEDPAAELQECHRILAPGGIVGLRVRNVEIQLWLCRWYSGPFRLLRRLRVKPLHVFHHYNFTRSAIERLLENNGFVNLSVRNSPLTTGDPYEYTSVSALVQLCKFMAGALADIVFRLTSGRWILSPSLLVWAQKP